MGQDQGKESVSLMCVDLCCVNSDVIDGLLEKERNQAQTLLLRAAAAVLDGWQNVVFWSVRIHINLEYICQTKHTHTHTSHRLCLSSYPHITPPPPAVIVHELRLVCAEHSTAILAQDIKELPPSSRPSCAPQHASAGPGDGALFALSDLFGFYSRYPTVVASAEPSVCCCTVCTSV